MTPPIDPDTLAKLRAHIAAAALATVASGAVACKKEPPTSAPNNPMPHTINEPVHATPNSPVPQPTPQELANLPQGRSAPGQDTNEPANLPANHPEAGTVAQLADAAPQVINATPNTQSVNAPQPQRADDAAAPQVINATPNSQTVNAPQPQRPANAAVPTPNLPAPSQRRTPPGNG